VRGDMYIAYITCVIFQVDWYTARDAQSFKPLAYCKVYAYIVKHNYVLGGMLFTIRKA